MTFPPSFAASKSWLTLAIISLFSEGSLTMSVPVLLSSLCDAAEGTSTLDSADSSPDRTITFPPSFASSKCRLMFAIMDSFSGKSTAILASVLLLLFCGAEGTSTLDSANSSSDRSIAFPPSFASSKHHLTFAIMASFSGESTTMSASVLLLLLPDVEGTSRSDSAESSLVKSTTTFSHCGETKH